MNDIRNDRILVIDLGSPMTQLIAQQVRDLGIYCEVWGWDHDADEIAGYHPRGVILSGAGQSVADEAAAQIPRQVFELDVPLLAIGHAMHSMIRQLGGTVAPAPAKPGGVVTIRKESPCHLLAAQDTTFNAWLEAGDRIIGVPDGFVVCAGTAQAAVAAVADEQRRWYGLQFHPEVDAGEEGRRILQRFIVDICHCAALWSPRHIIDDALRSIREQVGKDKVLLGLSGGVDSSVVAALLERAIGDQLTCVFVDTGLLRQGEGDQVMATMAEHMGVHVIRVDAADRFFSALAGVSDPEAKRKVIGGLFIDIFEQQAKQLDDIRWLAQGTIYPDIIESAGSSSGGAQLIKSHHNVGGLPERMNLKLVEPLRELFKDEVRRIGVELGLPREMVYRHPFPGPGLGVRVLGEVRCEHVAILQRADHIFIEELRRHQLYDEVSQAFAVFLPVRSVGIVDEARAYEWVISLRAVQTVDFMTARAAHLPPKLLDTVATRIINEVDGVSRVVYDISAKPPATIEWE